eukprot:jgi/Galph1/5585/GphlegSOOS_G4289.1
MESKIASAFLTKQRVSNALKLASLSFCQLQEINLKAWKEAAKCQSFPEDFNSFLDPSFLVSDRLDTILASLNNHINTDPSGDVELAEINNMDELLDRIDQLRLLLCRAEDGSCKENTPGEGTIDPQGPVGQFLRRIILAFDCLTWENIAQLLETWKVLEIEEEDNMNVAESLYVDMNVPSSLLPASDHEAHRLIEAVANGNMPDEEIQVLSVSRNDTNVTKTEFARYLMAMENRDITSACFSLHRYFDLELCTLGCGSQYASLLLAASHLVMGNQHDSAVHLMETIRVSQQSNDQHCQIQALLWLCLADSSRRQTFMERIKELAGDVSTKWIASMSLIEEQISGRGALQKQDAFTTLQNRKPKHMEELLKCLLVDTELNVDIKGVSMCLLEAEMWKIRGFLDVAFIILEDSFQQEQMCSYHSLQCLCALSNLEKEQGNIEGALERFDKMIDLYMRNKKELKRPNEKQIISKQLLLLLFERAYYRQHLQAAKMIFGRIQSLGMSSIGNQNDQREIMLALQQVNYFLLRMQHDYQSALKTCLEWEKLAISYERPISYLEAKVRESEIYLEMKAIGKAVIILSYHLFNIVMRHSVSLHQLETAKKILEQVEPFLFNSIPLLYRGQAMLVRGRIRIESIGNEKNQLGEEEIRNILCAAQEDIQNALRCFEKLHAIRYFREGYYLLRMVQDALNNEVHSMPSFLHLQNSYQQENSYYIHFLEKLRRIEA